MSLTGMELIFFTAAHMVPFQISDLNGETAHLCFTCWTVPAQH